VGKGRGLSNITKLRRTLRGTPLALIYYYMFVPAYAYIVLHRWFKKYLKQIKGGEGFYLKQEVLRVLWETMMSARTKASGTMGKPISNCKKINPNQGNNIIANE
jgi:hypothetical protein